MRMFANTAGNSVNATEGLGLAGSARGWAGVSTTAGVFSLAHFGISLIKSEPHLRLFALGCSIVFGLASTYYANKDDPASTDSNHTMSL